MSLMEILDFVSALMIPLITIFGVWVRALIDEIKYLKSAVSRLTEENAREHSQVMGSVHTLSDSLTQEVRGIVAQHHDHDKEMVKLACKLDQLVK